MELNDWILALHLLSAVAMVAAVTVFSVMIAALWRTDDPAAVTSFMRLGLVGNALVIVGSLGTIVFGVWLAISLDAYQLWDGWVIAALVLWFVLGALGSRTGKIYDATRARARTLAQEGSDAPNAELQAMVQDRRGLWLHVAGIVTVLLLLVDMVWKPGA